MTNYEENVCVEEVKTNEENGEYLTPKGRRKLFEVADFSGVIFRFLLKHFLIGAFATAFAALGLYSNGFTMKLIAVISAAFLGRLVYRDIIRVLNNEEGYGLSVVELIKKIRSLTKR